MRCILLLISAMLAVLIMAGVASYSVALARTPVYQGSQVCYQGYCKFCKINFIYSTDGGICRYCRKSN